MAITLETIATPGSSPIANNSASAQEFANDYYKISAAGPLSQRDRKTISVLALIYELSGSGEDYKTNHAGLMQDAQVWTKGISQFDMVTAMSAIDWSIGKNADGSLSDDVSALMTEGADFKTLSDDELDRIIAFLNAQIGV